MIEVYTCFVRCIASSREYVASNVEIISLWESTSLLNIYLPQQARTHIMTIFCNIVPNFAKKNSLAVGHSICTLWIAHCLHKLQSWPELQEERKALVQQ